MAVPRKRTDCKANKLSNATCKGNQDRIWCVHSVCCFLCYQQMIVREIPGWTIVSQQGREPIKNCQCPYIRTVPQFRFYPAWISISFNMHFSTLIFFLVSSLSITAALPVPGSDSNSENDRAVNTLFSKNGIWVFHDRGPLVRLIFRSGLYNERSLCTDSSGS